MTDDRLEAAARAAYEEMWVPSSWDGQLEIYQELWRRIAAAVAAVLCPPEAERRVVEAARAWVAIQRQMESSTVTELAEFDALSDANYEAGDELCDAVAALDAAGQERGS